MIGAHGQERAQPPPPPGRRHERPGRGRGGAQLGEQRLLAAEERLRSAALRGPAPGRCERDDALGAPASGEGQGEEAPERVADQVRPADAGRVEKRLEAVEEHRRPGARERWAAGMPGEGGCEDVVATLEPRQQQLEGAPAGREAVRRQTSVGPLPPRWAARGKGCGEDAGAAQTSTWEPMITVRSSAGRSTRSGWPRCGRWRGTAACASGAMPGRLGAPDGDAGEEVGGAVEVELAASSRPCRRARARAAGRAGPGSRSGR